MKQYNLSLGSPIQSALQKSNELANFLWNQATEKERIIISNSVDESGNTSLISAIHANNEYLFNEITDEKYNITKTDSKWRTPFMHCCITNNTSFIKKLFEKLPLEEINKTDRDRNSALTYVCNNNNRDVADFMFINDVYLGGMNLDNNGIIQFYIERVKYIEELKCSTCKKVYDKTNEHKKYERDLKSLKADEFWDKFSMAPTQGENESYYNYQARFEGYSQAMRNEFNKREKMMNELKEKIGRAYDDLRSAEYLLNKLRKATRKDMLCDFAKLISSDRYENANYVISFSNEDE